MYNIQKIADEIFQAPTKEDLFQRALASFIKNPDGTYSDSTGINVRLTKMFVKNGKFKVKFKSIDGHFNCSALGLTSLEGAPEFAIAFDCSGNNLTSLKGGPKRVTQSYYCDHNQLTTLKDAPIRVAFQFDCSHNNLTSLVGAPKEVGTFDCSFNSKSFTTEDVLDVTIVGRQYIRT